RSLIWSVRSATWTCVAPVSDSLRPKRETSSRLRCAVIVIGAVAEAEVLADRDLAGVQPLDQDPVDEFLRRQLGEGAVEADDHHLLDAERCDQVGLDLGAGEELGR